MNDVGATWEVKQRSVSAICRQGLCVTQSPRPCGETTAKGKPRNRALGRRSSGGKSDGYASSKSPYTTTARPGVGQTYPSRSR